MVPPGSVLVPGHKMLLTRPGTQAGIQGPVMGHRRALASTLLVALLAACASQTRSGTVPTPTARVVGGLSDSGVPLPTVAAAAVPGRIVTVRAGALVVIDAGRTMTIVPPPAGGEVKTPAWSPDGRSIAYAQTSRSAAPRAGRPSPDELPTTDLLVAAADGSGARVAVRHDGPGGQVDGPVWTPDGRALVYSYYRAAYDGDQFVADTLEVRRSDLGTGATTTLVQNASSPTLSGDGRQLAYLRDDSAVGQSVVVAPFGEAAERTLVRPADFAQLQGPALSPDGAIVAFAAARVPTAGSIGRDTLALAPRDLARSLLAAAPASAHGFPWEIWLVPAAGGAARQVTSIGEDSPFVRWSPDGARLLVAGGGGLYLVDLRAGTTSFVDASGSHGGVDWHP